MDRARDDSEADAGVDDAAATVRRRWRVFNLFMFDDDVQCDDVTITMMSSRSRRSKWGRIRIQIELFELFEMLLLLLLLFTNGNNGSLDSPSSVKMGVRAILGPCHSQ